VIEIEATYKYNIDNRNSPDIDAFLSDLDDVAEEASELAVIAEVKGFDVESGGASKMGEVASSMSAIAENYAGSADLDDVPEKTTPEELYRSSTTARSSMPILAESSNSS
jgi:hypothetical protein